MTYTPGLNGGRINATISGNTAGAGALISTGTVTLAGGNNITLSQAGNAITISGGAGGGAAGSNTIGMSNLGNSIGTSGVISGSALQYAIAGGNNVTLSQSINGSSATLTISAFNQSVQTQNLIDMTLAGNSTSAGGGYALVSSGTLTLAGGNNVTLSQAGNAITISGGNVIGVGGTNTLGISNLGNTAGTSGVITGTNVQLAFAGGNNITLSQSVVLSSATITVSAPNQSVQTQSNIQAIYDGANSISTGTVQYSNSNGVSFGINGQTLTASVPLNATVSHYVYPNEYIPLNTSGATNNSISFNYVSLDQDVAASQFRALLSVSANTHTSASTNTFGLTAEVGVYTRNASTISRMSSGSQTWSGTYSSNTTASVQGIREVTVPMTVAMSPGEYWVGLRLSSSSSNASVGYSLFQVSNQATVHLNPGRFGAATATSQLLYPWNGIYSATSSALPASATVNDVLGSGTQGSRVQYWFDMRNYTVI